jgi:hypothetical protein
MNENPSHFPDPDADANPGPTLSSSSSSEGATAFEGVRNSKKFKRFSAELAAKR